MKVLTLLILVITLSGCSLFSRNITVDAEVEKIPFIHPSSPNKMFLQEVKWTVMNKERLQEVLDSLGPDENVAMFVLTSKGYENLSENMAEVTRYIKDQKAVIVYYRTSIEAGEKDETEVQ
jgi:hypothetical protein